MHAPLRRWPETRFFEEGLAYKNHVKLQTNLFSQLIEARKCVSKKIKALGALKWSTPCGSASTCRKCQTTARSIHYLHSK